MEVGGKSKEKREFGIGLKPLTSNLQRFWRTTR